MIASVGLTNLSPVRFDRPRPSVSPSPDAGLTDQVEPFSAPTSAPRPRNLADQALTAAGNACKAALFGPVAHYVGKVVVALGKAPEPRKPAVPPSELTDLPKASLSRPVVLVAGWHTNPLRFGPLTEKLTEDGSNGGAVGYLKGGQVFADPHCTQTLENPPADMKVFVSLLESDRTDPEAAQPELTQNLQTVQRLTGGATMDFVPFSMGSLQTLYYVDQHEKPNIGKVMFVAAPLQGAGLAGLSHHLLEGKDRGWDTDWLLRIKDVNEYDRGALQWLRPHSEQREDLHSRHDIQRARVEDMMCIGSHAKKTLGANLWVGPGDGMVPVSSMKLGNVPVELVEDKCPHGELIQSPSIYQRMLTYFDWA